MPPSVPFVLTEPPSPKPSFLVPINKGNSRSKTKHTETQTIPSPEVPLRNLRAPLLKGLVDTKFGEVNSTPEQRRVPWRQNLKDSTKGNFNNMKRTQGQWYSPEITFDKVNAMINSTGPSPEYIQEVTLPQRFSSFDIPTRVARR
jgi:hypothetical protein